MIDGDRFPERCIRGIWSKEGIDEGRAATALFIFRSNNARQDGWIEESINWEDTDEVVDFTLKQERDDHELQFQFGVAVLPRRELDHIKRSQMVAQSLSYERAVLPDNPYHGNILLRIEVPKKLVRQIAATLALHSKVIQRRATD